jgi:outer membrane protein assembly factor BamB
MKHCKLLPGIVTVFVGVLLLSAIRAPAADWPQWRGPQRDGISKETGLLQEWPQGGPKLLWQVSDIGSGYSTPAVVGSRIYLLGNTGTEDEFAKALAVKGGSEVWSTRIGKVGLPNQQPPYPGARSTPTVDGDVLYAMGSDGDLACIELGGGKIRWQKNVQTDFGGKPGIWAYSESPLVDGDTVVCSPGGEEAALVALNKKTGEMIWKCALPEVEAAGYSSIVSTGTGAYKQYVQFLGKSLVGVDAKSGKLLWRDMKKADKDLPNIPTPTIDAPFVYSVPMRMGGRLIKLDTLHLAADPQEIYFSPKLPKAIGGTVKIGNYLYGTGEALMCVDFATGDIKWSERGIGTASICYADGCFYLHGENGDVALVEASPDAYHERGRFTPPNQPDRGSANAWAYPAVANGRLYIRDQGVLWCYDVSAGKGAE